MLRLLPATASYTNLVEKNQFPELNRHILTFSQQIVLSGVWVGDALKEESRLPPSKSQQ